MIVNSCVHNLICEVLVKKSGTCTDQCVLDTYSNIYKCSISDMLCFQRTTFTVQALGFIRWINNLSKKIKWVMHIDWQMCARCLVKSAQRGWPSGHDTCRGMKTPCVLHIEHGVLLHTPCWQLWCWSKYDQSLWDNKECIYQAVLRWIDTKCTHAERLCLHVGWGDIWYGGVLIGNRWDCDVCL